MANPFKDLKELTREVENYLRKNSAAIFNNSKRVSDFFEMACYNNIVRFYENNGYEVKIKNLQKNKFKYKCTTAGNPENYSYFEIQKKIGKTDYTYEIRHNINVESYHTSGIYTTPDISIIKPNSILISEEFYDTKTKYYFVKNKSLISFCEVKNFNPYPELLFNFIGVVNELKPHLLRVVKRNSNNHIATTLMLSGKSNKHTDKIILNLQNRYYINILPDLFIIGGMTFSKKTISKIKKI